MAQLINAPSHNLKLTLMKKVLFAMLFVAGTVVAASAQEAAQDTTAASSAAVNEAANENEDRVSIKTDELPEAVKQTLQDQEYKGWLINAAYHDKKEEQYEVELKNGAETQTVKFSQEGQRLDD
jgi:hypothetical protein